MEFGMLKMTGIMKVIGLTLLLIGSITQDLLSSDVALLTY